MGLALLEEFLWDALVYQEYLPYWCRRWTADHAAGALVTAPSVCDRLWGVSEDAGASPPPPTPMSVPVHRPEWDSFRISLAKRHMHLGAAVDEGEGEDADETPLLELSETGLAIATAALATPQLVHYVLDAYIWKMDPKSNPRLKEYLLGGAPPKEGAIPPASDAAAATRAESKLSVVAGASEHTHSAFGFACESKLVKA